MTFDGLAQINLAHFFGVMHCATLYIIIYARIIISSWRKSSLLCLTASWVAILHGQILCLHIYTHTTRSWTRFTWFVYLPLRQSLPLTMVPTINSGPSSGGSSAPEVYQPKKQPNLAENLGVAWIWQPRLVPTVCLGSNSRSRLTTLG